jgi:hypothetical protein
MRNALQASLSSSAYFLLERVSEYTTKGTKNTKVVSSKGKIRANT